MWNGLWRYYINVTRKKVIPHKHYAAHAGKVYELGTAALTHANGVVSFVGLAFPVPRGQAHGNPDIFKATLDSYLNWQDSLMACNQMINDWTGLGECFREDGEFGKA